MAPQLDIVVQGVPWALCVSHLAMAEYFVVRLDVAKLDACSYYGLCSIPLGFWGDFLCEKKVYSNWES